MPESPKFLLTTKKYDECRAVMSMISRINGRGDTFDGKFDKEVQEVSEKFIVNNSVRENSVAPTEPSKS
jgi:hypothetical protein